MSVLIKGIKMPEDCFSCPLKEEGFCNITNVYAGGINERNSDCPLVELPEKHGRLIDAFELLRALIRKKPFSDCARVVIAECMKEIRQASTVIEAEGVDE